MRPIFEQAPLRAEPPCGTVQPIAVIGSHAREGWQIMSPGENIHAVDLMEAKRARCASKGRFRRNARAPLSKALGGECDALGLGKGYRVDHEGPDLIDERGRLQHPEIADATRTGHSYEGDKE